MKYKRRIILKALLEAIVAIECTLLAVITLGLLYTTVDIQGKADPSSRQLLEGRTYTCRTFQNGIFFPCTFVELVQQFIGGVIFWFLLISVQLIWPLPPIGYVIIIPLVTYFYKKMPKKEKLL